MRRDAFRLLAVAGVLAAPWPAGLPDGVYQVAYRVVSRDGHPVIGANSFTVGMAAASSVMTVRATC